MVVDGVRALLLLHTPIACDGGEDIYYVSNHMYAATVPVFCIGFFCPFNELSAAWCTGCGGDIGYCEYSTKREMPHRGQNNRF